MSKWKIMVRELLVFVASVSILPMFALVVLSQQYSLNTMLAGALREMLAGPTYSGHGPAALWVRILTPYLLLQGIRAWYWSQKSIVGRRWAYLYFSLVFFGACLWWLSAAWDLFYFMYALGDIPGEIGQFLELEGSDLVMGFGALLLALYSVLIFLNPSSGRYKSR